MTSCFRYSWNKYIVCDVYGLRSPSFKSSSVLYISPTDTSSMQDLILESLQQKLQKSCSRCIKQSPTWHVESSYILQPPKYLLLFVNRFRYINYNVTKDRCPIPMDTTVRLGPLKFSLPATIDHHGPSIHSGHYTAYINCCQKTFFCNDHTITEFGSTDINSYTAYVILYELFDTWFWDSNRRVGVWSLPWRWHILSIPLTAGRGTSAETCGLDNVSSWWPCFPSRSSVLIYIYVYAFLIRVLLYDVYIYIYIYMTGMSFSIGEAAPHHVLEDCISGQCAVPGLNATFCFLWFTNCVLLFDKSLILGCLWPLVFALNNTLILGIWCSTIPYLPGCFCPWTFFQNIGFNMVLTDPFMSHLATQVRYFAGEFQALQLIVLAAFGVVD